MILIVYVYCIRITVYDYSDSRPRKDYYKNSIPKATYEGYSFNAKTGDCV